MKLILGVSGSIGAYKAMDIMRLLPKERPRGHRGHDPGGDAHHRRR